MAKGMFYPSTGEVIVFVLLLLIVFGFAYKYPSSFSKYFGYRTVSSDCPSGEDCVQYHYVRLLFELIVLYALAAFIMRVISKYFMESG